MQQKDQEEYRTQLTLSNTLLNNLCIALQSASVDASSTLQNGDNPNKRMKIESGNGVLPVLVSSAGNIHASTSTTPDRDVYNILDPGFSKGTDIVHIPGAIIARLTIGGLMNALAGTPNGIVDITTSKPFPPTTKESLVPPSQNAPIHQIQTKALALSHVISARLEGDMMQSTPKRIADMLCPEVTIGEIAGIRRRIYETVILGRGTNSSANAAAMERTEDLPVAARVGMHDIDKVRNRRMQCDALHCIALVK